MIISGLQTLVSSAAAVDFCICLKKEQIFFALSTFFRIFASMIRWASILFLVILSAACLLFPACDGGGRQRIQLEELERQNRADSLMTNDSLALSLAGWFDRHGTANEQLRAHYILGRTYADLGEAPQAIDAYNDAVDRADTTANDCDYYTLCRVYSQMAELFYQQNLITDNLRCLDKSIEYAYMVGDTIAALNSYGQKIVAFDLQNNPDSVIQCSSKIKVLPDLYYQYLSIVFNAYIKLSDLENARRCMKTYEEKSGYFDSLGNIEKGREAYYHIKGCYYSAIGEQDSAELYYRKELQNGRDYNNQNMAARSLSLLFKIQNKTDSAAKYGLYSYQMVDSVYMRMSTRTVARIQAMHDYSRYQHNAQRERERANQERGKVRLLLGVVVLSFFVLAYVFHRIRLFRQKTYKAFKAKVVELEQVQSDVLKLRSNEENLHNLICEKESKMNQLNNEISSLRNNKMSSEKETEQRLQKSPVYHMLHKKANQGELLGEEDWSQLNRLIIETLPGFYQYVMSEQYKIGINEYRTLLLLRLHVNPKPISYLLGCTPQNVTKISKTVLSKLFHVTGTCSDLRNRIINMF